LGLLWAGMLSRPRQRGASLPAQAGD
jgi:hypothetical protein